MTRFALSLLLLSTLSVPVPASQAAERQQWNFRVLLDGRAIGEHRFTLSSDGAGRQLSSEARFAVRWLFVDAWSYLHHSVETWHGDCLRSLTAHTITNGSTERVHAETRDGRLVVERPSEQRQLNGCIQSFAYWNPSILEARSLLNSQTGELQDVRITPLGTENLTVRGAALQARRYRISAPAMQIDLWYADQHWVALESRVKGNRLLRYELT